MLWLAAHMWFLLLFAFATGLAIGWWIWGGRKRPAGLEPEEPVMGSLEDDFAVPAPEPETDFDGEDNR